MNSCHGAAIEFVCQVCLVYLVTSPDDSDNIPTTALRTGCAYNIQKQTKKGTYSIAYITAESHIKSSYQYFCQVPKYAIDEQTYSSPLFGFRDT